MGSWNKLLFEKQCIVFIMYVLLNSFSKLPCSIPPRGLVNVSYSPYPLFLDLQIRCCCRRHCIHPKGCYFLAAGTGEWLCSCQRDMVYGSSTEEAEKNFLVMAELLPFSGFNERDDTRGFQKLRCTNASNITTEMQVASEILHM